MNAVQAIIKIRPNISATDPSMPCIAKENSCIKVIDDNSLEVKYQTKNQIANFQFDKIIDQVSSNEDFFGSQVLPLIDEALKGFNSQLIFIKIKLFQVILSENATFFAYGHTGAGKSFTIFGDAKKQVQGVLNLIKIKQFNYCKKVFQFQMIINNCIQSNLAADYIQANLQSKKEWLLSCTFIEIYNEQVRDLLLTPGDPCPQVTIREDGQGKIILCGAKEISLSDLSAGQNKQGSLFSINQVIQLGNQNKTVGSTMANSQSSRSHSIFTFNIKYKTEDGQLISSKLNIIDLAGSERIQDTQAQGKLIQ